MALNKAKMADQMSAVASGVPFYKWKPTNRFRIVPALHDDETFFMTFAQHWVDLGQPERQGDKVPRIGFYCPKKPPFNEARCVICDHYVTAAYNLDKDVGKAIRAKPRAFFQAVDADDPKAGLQMVAAPIECISKIVTLMDEGFDLVDVRGGHVITVTRSGKGLETKYNAAGQPKVTPLSDLGDVAEILGARVNFVDFIRGQQTEAMQFAAAALGWRPELRREIPESAQPKAITSGDMAGSAEDWEDAPPPPSARQLGHRETNVESSEPHPPARRLGGLSLRRRPQTPAPTPVATLSHQPANSQDDLDDIPF